MVISENHRLRDTQQKEQIFTTVPVNCVMEDYLLTNGETERDLKSSLTISSTASAQEPGTAREGREAIPPVEPPRPIKAYYQMLAHTNRLGYVLPYHML